jgi:drug/metabolite transporter (DMT)-like permease
MTSAAPDRVVISRRRASGWLEACCFVLALTALNLAYGAGHSLGVHPVAFIACAMLFAAMALLAITGPGEDWGAIVRHPLSWVVGFGIIGMEAAYYMLLRFVTPADGSLLIRLNLPFSVLVGWLLLRRPVNGATVTGIAFVLFAVVWFLGGIDPTVQVTAMMLALTCALISVTRNFSAEFHPHNRAATTVFEKMRITGLMLMVTSFTGTCVVALAMILTAFRVLPPMAAIPPPEAFLELPTIALGALMGLLVLTAMQYFGFSSVVKIGTENFIAANSFVPLTTLAAQQAAVSLGWLAVALPDWRFFVTLAAILIGVAIYIAGARR